MDSYDHSVWLIQTQTKTVPGKSNLFKHLTIKMLNKNQNCIKLFWFSFPPPPYYGNMKKIEELGEYGLEVSLWMQEDGIIISTLTFIGCFRVVMSYISLFFNPHDTLSKYQPSPFNRSCGLEKLTWPRSCNWQDWRSCL